MKLVLILFAFLISAATLSCTGTTAVDDVTEIVNDPTCTSGTDLVETPTMINGPTALSCVTNISPDAPDWIKDNFHCVTVKACATNYVFITNNLPPYKTPYYSVASGNNIAFATTGLSDGAVRFKNPNTIASQTITMTIPKTPTYKSSSLDVTMGSGLDCLGLTVHGTCIFNNQAAPGDSLATEFQTMDNGDGHPQGSGKYHYHTEPYFISDNDDAFIGIAMDGYPIYGKKIQGTASNPSLDATTNTVACTTTEFPSGTYCYHVANGAGVNAHMIESYFRGAKGSVE